MRRRLVLWCVGCLMVAGCWGSDWWPPNWRHEDGGFPQTDGPARDAGSDSADAAADAMDGDAQAADAGSDLADDAPGGDAGAPLDLGGGLTERPSLPLMEHLTDGPCTFWPNALPPDDSYPPPFKMGNEYWLVSDQSDFVVSRSASGWTILNWGRPPVFGDFSQAKSFLRVDPENGVVAARRSDGAAVFRNGAWKSFALPNVMAVEASGGDVLVVTFDGLYRLVGDSLQAVLTRDADEREFLAVAKAGKTIYVAGDSGGRWFDGTRWNKFVLPDPYSNVYELAFVSEHEVYANAGGTLLRIDGGVVVPQAPPLTTCSAGGSAVITSLEAGGGRLILKQCARWFAFSAGAWEPLFAEGEDDRDLAIAADGTITWRSNSPDIPPGRIQSDYAVLVDGQPVFIARRVEAGRPDVTLSGRSSDEIYAADDRSVWRLDGDEWSLMPGFERFTNMQSLQQTADGTFFVVDTKKAYRGTPGDWTEVSGGNEVTRFSARSADDFYLLSTVNSGDRFFPFSYPLRRFKSGAWSLLSSSICPAAGTSPPAPTGLEAIGSDDVMTTCEWSFSSSPVDNALDFLWHLTPGAGTPLVWSARGQEKNWRKSLSVWTTLTDEWPIPPGDSSFTPVGLAGQDANHLVGLSAGAIARSDDHGPWKVTRSWMIGDASFGRGPLASYVAPQMWSDGRMAISSNAMGLVRCNLPTDGL